MTQHHPDSAVPTDHTDATDRTDDPDDTDNIDDQPDSEWLLDAWVHKPAPFEVRPDDTGTGEEPAWSTWDVAEHGPEPIPDWVVTDLAALDTDLGILKTGKEADVHVLRREVPGGRGCVLAAKRYRAPEHRMFARDGAYTEGRRVRESRQMRAMARRTSFGRELLAGQWAAAEFAALGRLWTAGAAVPYPVQLNGTELLMEFIGDDGVAAPRLAATRPRPALLADLFEQLRASMLTMARHGWAHGDLSAYNLLVHHDRLVLIDLPQVLDVVANPNGQDFLHRDCVNVCTWFAARGLGGAAADPEELFGQLVAEAVGRW